MAKKTDALDLLKPDFEQVGRHRARKTARERWFELLWLAVASAVLSLGGYFGLQYAVATLATPAPQKTIVKGVDISTPITVIDGTGTRQYAARIGQKLLDANYVVPYSVTLDNDLTKTVIYIQKEDSRVLANRIQLVLGEMPVEVKADAKYPIEVRLGLDFNPEP
ncbi:MAG: LytR family transcriptional regulator [Micrococcales bacterium]|nr:LytR family transcriptional regulator [Micrococcales bacterium]NBS85620.1 LytR family transcriptional regulator [Micrococcales bacterium]